MLTDKTDLTANCNREAERADIMGTIVVHVCVCL